MPKKAAPAVVARQREADAVERSPRALKKEEPSLIVPGSLDQFIGAFKLPTLPKTDAAKADMLYTTREDRLRLQKVVDQMEAREKELRQYFIDNLSKKDSTGVAGKRARVQIVTEEQPVVSDWDEFYKHIKKKGEFDLLNRAVNRTAVKARWDANKQIPGVGSFTVSKVSVTKV